MTRRSGSLSRYVILFVFIAASLVANPMKNKSADIERALLREKPLRTTKAQIERWLLREKRLNPSSSQVGFLRQDPPPSRVVGVSSIKAKLGEYRRFPFQRISIVAYWGFDEKDELIEVWVWKTIDAL